MITNETFISYLQCGRKGYWEAAAMRGDPPDNLTISIELDIMYQARALRAYLEGTPERDIVRGAFEPSAYAWNATSNLSVAVTLGAREFYSQMRAGFDLRGSPIRFLAEEVSQLDAATWLANAR